MRGGVVGWGRSGGELRGGGGCSIGVGGGSRGAVVAGKSTELVGGFETLRAGPHAGMLWEEARGVVGGIFEGIWGEGSRIGLC